MPRNKPKKRLNSRKPQLQFIEPPLDGARHHHGSQVQSAANPRLFLSKNQRQSSTRNSSWVMPQFDTNMQLQNFGPQRGRRWKGHKADSSILNRSSTLSLPQPKKTSVCKFPPLTFDTSISSPPEGPAVTYGLKVLNPHMDELETSHVAGLASNAAPPSIESSSMMETPKQVTSLKRRTIKDTACRVIAPGVAASTRDTEAQLADNYGHTSGPVYMITPDNMKSNQRDSVFTPPDLDTPETQESKNCKLSSKLPFLLPDLTETVSYNQPSEILVMDTPEQDYGVKVTWRKRKRLMRFLMEQGQLSSTEVAINK
ncbi:RAD9, HUS1, RAD1-interacting nuclear orphan protein 1 [Brienomyrus brachyistius]|uniref:RAD9, HUS1, RAD1-interacting nuclear orphan protein 1 n=1 Tax=Brienomyrus brachyistius TaxID=42636 RepID=UPI0020B260ED|nr:RAD9, HUS1, RAD1-interacting nuclear orphan protein 1 [Brienomyrus brachyistius]